MAPLTMAPAAPAGRGVALTLLIPWLPLPWPLLLQAAVACVDCMTPEEVASGRTFPELRHIRDVSRKVASVDSSLASVDS
jgi:hypothetical protein